MKYQSKINGIQKIMISYDIFIFNISYDSTRFFFKEKSAQDKMFEILIID